MVVFLLGMYIWHQSSRRRKHHRGDAISQEFRPRKLVYCGAVATTTPNTIQQEQNNYHYSLLKMQAEELTARLVRYNYCYESYIPCSIYTTPFSSYDRS